MRDWGATWLVVCTLTWMALFGSAQPIMAARGCRRESLPQSAPRRVCQARSSATWAMLTVVICGWAHRPAFCASAKRSFIAVPTVRSRHCVVCGMAWLKDWLRKPAQADFNLALAKQPMGDSGFQPLKDWQ